MKKNESQHSLFMLTVLLFILLSCNNQQAPKMVTVPFTLEALGEYKFAGPDTLPDVRCTGDLSAWRVLVDAKGSGDPVGQCTIHFDFCGDTLGHYGDLDAYLVAESGDTLFFTGSGQVLPGRLDDHPEFVNSYWKDKFEFTGGTGKYEGASGTFETDDYNSNEDMFSHHIWAGTLTMAEEK